jgi:hypothetical protein
VNEAVKWMIGGMFLLSFHINFMGIPLFPGIVGCLAFRHGFRLMKGEDSGKENVWSHKMEQTGSLWLGITVLDLILAVFMSQPTGIFIQSAAVLMLAETACGCSTLNYYRELRMQPTGEGGVKGPSAFGYLIWMTAGLASYEYSVAVGSGMWNTMGAVCVILGRIMLVKELAVWAPGAREDG